jgi:hypothetical protein
VVVRGLFAALAVLAGFLVIPDLHAYVRVWSGEATPGVFIAEVQRACGGMPPVPVTKCPWTGDYVRADRRSHREDVEVAGTAVDFETMREGTKIPAVDGGHSMKVFAASGNTDVPVWEVGVLLVDAALLVLGAFAGRSWLRRRRSETDAV